MFLVEILFWLNFSKYFHEITRKGTDEIYGIMQNRIICENGILFLMSVFKLYFIHILINL